MTTPFLVPMVPQGAVLEGPTVSGAGIGAGLAAIAEALTVIARARHCLQEDTTPPTEKELIPGPGRENNLLFCTILDWLFCVSVWRFGCAATSGAKKAPHKKTLFVVQTTIFSEWST
jgi:hypothetical protein